MGGHHAAHSKSPTLNQSANAIRTLSTHTYHLAVKVRFGTITRCRVQGPLPDMTTCNFLPHMQTLVPPCHQPHTHPRTCLLPPPYVLN
jgi:hypothetical protein